MVIEQQARIELRSMVQRRRYFCDNWMIGFTVCQLLLGYFLRKSFYQLRGAFNKFPDFFVLAFKIVVFSVLLVYILWDDWPIFMISRSNELLQ